MVARSVFVSGFTKTNRPRSLRYGACNRHGLGPLEKPITERTVSPKGDLTSFDDCLVSHRLVASDQKRKLTQETSMIVEAGHDFACRCIIASIRSCRASVKPGHRYSSSMPPGLASASVGMRH